MDRHWERTIPHYNLEMPTAQHLLRAVDRAWAVERITLLPDGKRNTNYKVTLRGVEKPYLLRIFGARDRWWEKELALHERVKSLVPVPKLYFLDASASVIEHPYAVYEYLDGMTLDRAPGGGEARIFEQLGEALAQLHAISYDSIGFFDRDLKIAHSLPPIHQWYAMFLGEHAHRKLGASLARQVADYVAGHHDCLLVLDATKTLVHGDFRPTNIMVKDGALQGIIDWEGAMSGHPLADIGQFLRYSEQVNAKHEQVFMTRYQTCAAHPLLEPYRDMAKLRDLVNLLQMINISATLPYKDRDLKRLIQKTVTRDY